MSFLGDAWGSLTGSTQAQGAGEAGRAEREELGKGLDYMMGRDELGNRIGDEALTGLSDLYLGDQSNQTAMIERAKASPLYESLMGQQQLGEDAIMRNASATGGLRSGNVQGTMYDYNTRFGADALNQAYGQQLEGLTGLAGAGDKNTGNLDRQSDV